MIHKAFCSVLATGALLLVGPAAHAATFELIDNGTTYDAVVTQEADDPLIFAVDMFIQASQGATLTVANNNGNPFDQATGNDNPPGNPDAILIGGSDISGTCDNSANSCFGDFSCGGGTCVFGRNGAIKLGEVNWDGNGTVSLRNNSQAAIANQDDGCDIDNTRHHPEQPKVFCMRSAYYLTAGNASALSLTIRVHNLGLEPRSVELSARIGEDPAQIRPVAPVATAVSVAGRAHLDVQFRLDLTAAFAASDDRAAPATTVTVSDGSGRSAGAAMCAVDFALWQQADG